MTAPTTTRPHLDHVEDVEGDGTCGQCGRDGLRWIAVLSDNSRVGLECSKALLGYKPAPKNHTWQANFDLVATHTEGTVTYGLWQRKTGEQTCQTRNGSLNMVGGARADWDRYGWI